MLDTLFYSGHYRVNSIYHQLTILLSSDIILLYPYTGNTLYHILLTFHQFWLVCYCHSTCLCSVQLSHSVVFNPLWPHVLKHAKFPCPSLSPGVCSNSCPLSQWCHPTISPLLPPSPPALNLSQHQGLFQWVSSSHQVAKVPELQLQYQSFQWIFRIDFF